MNSQEASYREIGLDRVWRENSLARRYALRPGETFTELRPSRPSGPLTAGRESFSLNLQSSVCQVMGWKPTL